MTRFSLLLCCCVVAVVACEVQLTLQDFVVIKRLMHAYYDIERADANFVFRNPVFLAHGLKAKIPSVVREMADEAEPNK